MNEKIILKGRCPQCGGELELTSDLNSIVCPYCHAKLFIERNENDIFQYYLPFKKGFERIDTSYIANNYISKNINPRFKKINIFKIFFPYWTMTADIVFELFGFKIRTKEKEYNRYAGYSGFESSFVTETIHEEDLSLKEIIKSSHWFFSIPAFKHDDIAFRSLGIRTSSLKFLPLDKEIINEIEGIFLPATQLPSNYFETQPKFKYIDSTYSMEYKIHKIIKKSINFDQALIYFPYWVVNFKVYDTEMSLTIDGITKEVAIVSDNFFLPQQQNSITNYKKLKFGVAICPNCGWDLSINPYTKKWFCKNCNHYWEPNGHKLEEVKYNINIPQTNFSVNDLNKQTLFPFYLVKTKITKKNMADNTINILKHVFKLKNISILDETSQSLIVNILLSGFLPHGFLQLIKTSSILSSNQYKTLKAENNYDIKINGFGHQLMKKDIRGLTELVILDILYSGIKNFNKKIPDIIIDILDTKEIFIPFTKKNMFWTETSDKISIEDTAINYVTNFNNIERL